VGGEIRQGGCSKRDTALMAKSATPGAGIGLELELKAEDRDHRRRPRIEPH